MIMLHDVHDTRKTKAMIMTSVSTPLSTNGFLMSVDLGVRQTTSSTLNQAPVGRQYALPNRA